MSKSKIDKDRKARVEEMRKAQQRIERRRTMVVIGASGIVVALLSTGVFMVVRAQLRQKDVTLVGTSAAAASCDAPITDAATGGSVHVGQGTDQPTVTKVDYATIPPSSGKHFATPQYPAQPFYTATDRPVLETLVHNLEHGYTVLWYTSTVPKTQLDELRRIADLTRKDSSTAGKFIVSAWDDTRGAFPAGKTIALSHWGAKEGHREFCGAVSGDAVKAFVKKFPSTDAPEPNAS